MRVISQITPNKETQYLTLLLAGLNPKTLNPVKIDTFSLDFKIKVDWAED